MGFKVITPLDEGIASAKKAVKGMAGGYSASDLAYAALGSGVNLGESLYALGRKGINSGQLYAAAHPYITGAGLIGAGAAATAAGICAWRNG